MAGAECPYLVGRETELAALRACLRGARDGHGAMVVVSGEAGLGKTRLVRELVEVANGAGFTILIGRAVPTSSQAVYRPIAEALAQAVRGREPLADGELSPWMPALRVMLPALAAAGDAPVEPRAVELSAHICGEALLRLLRGIADPRPLLVVLEDLHWADPDTLDVVEYVADNVGAEPMVFIGTVRTESPTAAIELARRVTQRGTATHLELGRLDEGEVAEMIRACAPDADVDVVARVRATAEGVPLLVEELVVTPGVPASVGEAVRTRVARLSDGDRSVLYAAAVLGRDFDWRLLPAITGRQLPEVTVALERLEAAMLLSVDGASFRFRHALTCEAVTAMLVPPRRATLASKALAALDSQRPGHEHADLALMAGEQARAGALFAAAGRASLRRGALGAAARALRRAVDVLDGPARTDAQASLVEALSLAGRADDALAVGDELLPGLETADGTIATVHFELARAAVAATRWPTAVTHIDAARAVLATHHDARLAAHLDVLAAEVALAADDVALATTTAHAALTASENLDAPEISCHALEVIGRGHRVHDLDAAKAAFNEAYRTADAAALPLWRLRALHELGTIELLDHAGTDALLAARRMADHVGAQSTAAVLDVQLCAAYHLRFDLDAARTHARRAVAYSTRLNLTHIAAMAKFFDAATSALRGDRKLTAEWAAAALRAAPGQAEFEGYVFCGGTGMLELLWGDRSEALDALDRGMAALHTVAHSSPGHYRGLWALLHAIEHHPDAARCITQVRESGATVMRANRGYLHYAEAVLLCSTDAVAAGDAELEFAPVWHHLGRMLVAEAALADGWGRPQQWLRAARGCFDAHGLDHLGRHCRGLLGETPRWQPAGVTRREAEVLELLVKGMANKQIATRLRLSVRTVEKHVESMLRKAGARSRTELVAMVRETT